MADATLYLYEADYQDIKLREAQLLAELPEWRRQKAVRIRKEEARFLSIAAGKLLQKVLGEEGTRVSFGEYGKPESRADGVYFNLSHSGNLVGLVLADQSVGLDVECKDDRELRVSRRMFCREETEWIENTEDRLRQDAFRMIWTRKEAYLKCKGIGISVPLNSFLTIDPKKRGLGYQPEYEFEEQEVCYCDDPDADACTGTGYYAKSLKYEGKTGERYDISIVLKKVNFSIDISIVESI